MTTVCPDNARPDMPTQADVSDELRTLRKSHRAARRGVEGAARAEAETALTGHVLANHSIRRSGVVSVFNADDGEPDMGAVIAGLRSGGTRIALPILRSGQMRFRIWAEDGPLVAGDFGLLEPADGPEIDAAELDASLTPLVAFDPKGNRVGRGAGFYDRTFGPAVARRDAGNHWGPLLVGIAFEVQRAATVPVRDHDVPMDLIVTDLGVRHRPAR